MSAASRSGDTDVLVIGAGPGGYVAAIRAAQHGTDVTLVDRDAVGGTCLNYGCIPSKAMITATNRVDDVLDADEMGIYAEPFVAVDEMVDWKDDVVDRLTGGVRKLCRANGVNLQTGVATFVDEHTARVESPEGTRQLSFDHAIVATGSRPIEVPGFGFDDDPVLDSRQALALDGVPSDLVVIGAGYIGMELSTVFAKLGSAVTVVEMLDSVLPTYDERLTRPVHDRATEIRIDLQFGERAVEWRKTGDGIVVVTQTDEGDRSEYPCDQVLVSVGREPVTDTVGLDALEVETDERGFLPTDDYCRTDLDHVYAVGDVAGEPMLAHKASHEGVVAAETIAGESPAVSGRSVPAAVFTDPEIGTVGLTEAEAESEGHEPLVGTFPLRASGRALTTGHADGFVRLVADASTERILGGQCVGPEASELVAEIGLAVELGATLDDLAGTVHAHPTLSEAVMEAAEHALGTAIHTTNR
jgi:dihydrolipoamide dehydrogenase